MITRNCPPSARAHLFTLPDYIQIIVLKIPESDYFRCMKTPTASILRLLCLLPLPLLLACEHRPVPHSGGIQIVFEGVATPGYGHQITLYFAEDSLQLAANRPAFSRTSIAPHQPMKIAELQARHWHYKLEISCNGPAIVRTGTVEVEAGEESTLEVKL